MDQNDALHYATVPLARDYSRVNFYFRATLICGAAPIVVGYTILFLYWLTCRTWLGNAACMVLPIGALSVLAGAFHFLKYYFAEQRLAQAAHTSPRYLRIVLALILLLTNFLVAGDIFRTCLHLGYWQTVDVINESGATIDNCIIETDRGSFRHTSGPITTGQKFRIALPMNRRDQVLNLEIQQGASRVTTTAAGSGNWTRIRIKPALSTTFEEIK